MGLNVLASECRTIEEKALSDNQEADLTVMMNGFAAGINEVVNQLKKDFEIQ